LRILGWNWPVEYSLRARAKQAPRTAGECDAETPPHATELLESEATVSLPAPAIEQRPAIKKSNTMSEETQC